MKKSTILLVLTALLWACNSGTPVANEVTDHAAVEHAHESSVSDLTLNEGQKWQGDVSTNQNVVALTTIAQQFDKEPHTNFSDYQLVAADLQKGLDKMIKECKMTGPDHDALHLWLEPILKNVNELSKAADEASANKIFHSINERLGMYVQYFE